MKDINELIEGLNAELGSFNGGVDGARLAHSLGLKGDDPMAKAAIHAGATIGRGVGYVHDHPFIAAAAGAAGAAGLVYKYLKNKQKDQSQKLQGSQHTHSQHTRQK